MDVAILGTMIPILGILAGIVIPIAVFIWQYYDANGTLISTGRDTDGDGKVDERN